ncbi:ubiquitin carboxyl-terminal hydrolase 16 [Megalops cyprinoides]|uniref:ubiquitin carboxyl-terminal hydrolase 16 n=1 Tax=Megalops cyprinoides TaxID=118141 RepID=UPI001863A841|nr:ubiquitin carboxyl-terminal hydrolase 16 [Megalops cyprinoides]
MGKKRAKEKSVKQDDSFDMPGPSCTHIRKGIDQSLLRKIAQDVNWFSCLECKEESVPSPSEEEELNGETPAIWVCLKCGHRGCGRNSENQHAIKHYEKPRSDPHCLVLSMDNWSVWCYICDDDVQYSSTGQLAQLVNNIKKQALSGSTKRTPQRKVKEEESQVNAVEEKLPEKEAISIQKKDPKRDTGDSKGQKLPAVGSGSTVSVKGLSNLGNTCFFNAVIQNLSQTQLLRQILKEITDDKTTLTITPLSTELEPIQVPLERPGALTLAMCQLLNEIQETKKGVVTPRELFTQVCKKAARFKGFQQQDSQELLRYLLDGMRAEEMKRVSLGIVEAVKKSGKNTDAEESKNLIKEYEKNGAPKNFVDQVFGGELTSTVMCKQCRTVSSVTEMFLDLSLPVSDEAYRKKNQKKVQKSTDAKDSDRDSPVPLTNGTEDIPSGAGSKYQQKKAKKQAKKQAKNQRRQQKLGSKVTWDTIANQDSAELVEGDETAAQGEKGESQAAVEDFASAGKPTGAEHTQEGSQVPDGDQQGKEKAPEEEEEEDETAECEDDVSVLNNRFTALAVDQNTEDGEEKINKENRAEEEDTVATEEDEVTEDMTRLSLNNVFVAPEDIQLDVENEEAPVDTREYTVVNQDPELAFHTLATRVAPEKQECSVQSCLFQFTEVENLTKNNSLLCVTCSRRQSRSKASEGAKEKVYTDALKQMLISSLPPVLTLHLKRFQQVSYSVCKVNRHVQFPQILDLAPFCSVNCKNVQEGQTQMLYSLYGIVEHSGTMRSGHYTAYVKARPTLPSHLNGPTTQGGDAEALKGSWYHISDTSVQPVPETKVQNSQAYLLFYERIS